MAKKILKQDIVNGLNGLPNEDLHCADLAAKTLKKALDNISGK